MHPPFHFNTRGERVAEMGEEEKKKTEEAAKPAEEASKGGAPKTEESSKDKMKSKESEAAEQPQLPLPPQEIILKVYMHCVGCARKVRRCLKDFEGVEDVITDCRTSKVVVKGEKADPLKVLERIQKKSHRQVELISPIPKPPAEDHKKPEEIIEVAKSEEKKKEEQPPVVTVVLGVYMHCEACAQEIKKRIERMKGVESAEPDLKSSQVTVKGAFEPEKLVDYVEKRTGKHAVISKVEQETKPEEKEKEGDKVKKAEEVEKETKKVEKGQEKEEKNVGTAGKLAGDQDEDSTMEFKRNESFHNYPQNYQECMSVKRSLRYVFRSIFRENVAGKVVVIAGASSGIGEHLAYEYGSRGAYLVIGARRDKALREVAETARWLGSPLVIPLRTDISKVEDCKRLIEEAIKNFGRLDHLVIPAGITPACMFEESFDVTNFKPAMDINFWGPVYTTYFAAPYLRMTKGKIVAIASSNSWLNAPRLSYYNASKAAVVSFFETMRVEFGSDIGITIVMPGLVESEMTKGKILSKDGKIVVDQEMRDVVMSVVPIKSVDRCAKEIVNSVCRADKYLTVPSWFRALFFFKMMCPEAVDWFNRWFCITEPDTSPPMSQKITKFPGLKEVAHPDSVRSPKIKT